MGRKKETHKEAREKKKKYQVQRAKQAVGTYEGRLIGRQGDWEGKIDVIWMSNWKGQSGTPRDQLNRIYFGPSPKGKKSSGTYEGRLMGWPSDWEGKDGDYLNGAQFEIKRATPGEQRIKKGCWECVWAKKIGSTNQDGKGEKMWVFERQIGKTTNKHIIIDQVLIGQNSAKQRGAL